MNRTCDQCGEKPAETESLPWYALILLWAVGSAGGSERYCADCAGGRNFIALLFAAAAALAAFVLFVIFW